MPTFVKQASAPHLGRELALAGPAAEAEVERTVTFLREQLAGERAVIGVSGGLDSDVTARLTARAVGPERLKFVTVVQTDMDPRHIAQARGLAADLGVPLVEADLSALPAELVGALARADPAEEFRPGGLLDPARAKCSLRTAVFSSYQDRGCVVVGTSNRTELETGFFLPLGDGIWHVAPLVHLYKTQVRGLAAAVGSRRAVLDQPASAGFWIGQEDLTDLAYWLFHGGPIGREVEFGAAAEAEVMDLRAALTTEGVDGGLLGLARNMDDSSIAADSGLPEPVVGRLRRMCAAAGPRKRRPLGVRLANYS